MRRDKQRMLAMLLVAVMVLAILPQVALAAPAIQATVSGIDTVVLTVTGATAGSTYRIYNGSTLFTTISPTATSFSLTVPGLAAGTYTFYVEQAVASPGTSTRIASNAVTIGMPYYWGWGNYYDSRLPAHASSYNYYGSGSLTYSLGVRPWDITRIGVDRRLLNEGTHYSLGTTSGNKAQVTFFESFLNTLSSGHHEFVFNTTGSTFYGSVYIYSRGGGGSSGRLSGAGKALRALTIYNKASSKGKKLDTFSKGDHFTLTGFSASGTYAIIDYFGRDGFVRADYISAPVPDTMMGRLSSSTYLYTAKSTKSADRYDKVDKGTWLELLRREGTYWIVSYDGFELYLPAKYIKTLTVG